MTIFKRYIARLTAWTIALLLLALAVNVAVDPYAIFGTPRIKGWNAAKPFAGDRGRVTKIYQVMAVKPNGLIIGNSRPELGLDPLHACWPQSDRPVYNMGIPGLGPYAQVRYAQHAMAAHMPHLLVIGTDFLDYLTNATSSDRSTWWPRAKVEPLPLLVTAQGKRRPGFIFDRLGNYVASSLSLEALYHSAATVALQEEKFTETRTPLGMNDGPAIYDPIVQDEGTSTLFLQKNREIMSRLNQPGLGIYVPGTHSSPELDALEHLLDEAQTNHVRTILVINPLHAEYLLTIDLNGLWPAFQEWKRALAERAAKHNMELWDFSVIDHKSTQAIASLKPKGESLKWFWEPAHYKKELGDLMLDNIFRSSCASASSSPAYGTLLRPDMMDEYLRRNRQRLEEYKANNPDVIRHLTDLAAG